MKYHIRKIIIAIIIISIGCMISCTSDRDSIDLSDEIIIESSRYDDIIEETTYSIQMIAVYVCGAVADPGVYDLQEDARVVDAIEAAGGMREDAASDSINLAEHISDGMKIYIPTVSEANQMNISSANISANISNKVNINTATKEELMTLRGIGEARATDIIAYREKHGRFDKIEDIMNISGIKQSAFEKIKDDITV